LNLKDRYQKSQIERCRGTKILKREWETDTVRDTDRCRGTQKLKKECDADTGRHRNKAGPH